MESRRRDDQVWDIQSIDHGWDVFDANGDKVGDVADVYAEYFVVSKGFIFTSERYIPASAIEQVTEDRVYLNVTKDDIETRGWDHVPETGVYEELDRPAARTADTAAGGETTDSDTLKLREERLRAEKDRVQAGEVTLGKDVVSEERAMDVPVTHEEVTVERHAVDPTRPARDDIDESEDREIHVPLHEERVRVEKEPVVYEEVDVNKRRVQDTQRVTGNVRREEARIETEGDVDDANIDAEERETGTDPLPPSR
ncbi:MAG TPA: YsnF/AvaK domain-containing protein [Thermomicrobiaceae bacterium]|nr:YsnF/AvaK domain-containing protein [Thermomicrobiaceae bacterium]